MAQNYEKVQNGDTSSRAEYGVKNPYELPGLPDTPEFAPGSERVSRLGDMAIARAGWGGQLSTEAIIEAGSRAGQLIELQITQLRNIGFDGGYRFSTEISDLFNPLLQWLQAGWATKLALKVIAERDWDTVDALYVGSSTTTPETVRQIRDNLEQRGVTVGRIQQHSLACQSWTTSTVDALIRSDLTGKNVVVVGLDTLSPMTDPNDPITYAIFGNGGGAFAFRPGEEMEYLHGTTRFEHDEKGITKCIPICALPPKEEWQPYPDNFLLVGEQTPEFLAVTRDGLVMCIPPTGNGKIIMDGVATFRYFVIESTSFDMIQNEVAWYVGHGKVEEYGPLDIPFGHQPSFEVIDGLNNYALKKYKREKLRGTPLQFPWVMRNTGFNNISAGTGLVAIEEMAHTGQLQPHSTHLMLGLGIGNSVGIHLVRFI